ncbi:MAG: hypothetical protein AUH29_06800 [Candidatus Rokubacteria bacterium 13_1_40CM_69_27]|nr:MAG: hypothetical protein AUH29_06800 [Candidatus Rokubacteria bacterium 13_1_40CM_69_27]OLC35959.1 MAG: hypothetical protein AUH81_09115 [Candidatus Rokubacteria bacterium 13_1_40CM_4_69_5]
MPRGRPVIALGLALGVIGALAGGLAWLLDIPKPPPGASRAARLYYGFCAECHGADGRGSWRAMLFLIRPGDLADPTRMSRHSDRYLSDIIKHGGAPLGRPGMPGFAFHLSDADIEALVHYVRGLSGQRAAQRSADGLDPDEGELVVHPPDCEPHAVARPGPARLEERGVSVDRHHLHRPHAEGGDGVMADEDHIGGGTGDDFSPHLVGGRPDDGAPDAGGEDRQQGGEEHRQKPASAAARDAQAAFTVTSAEES